MNQLIDKPDIHEFYEYLNISLPNNCPGITSVAKLDVKLKNKESKIINNGSYKKVKLSVLIEVLIIYYSKECSDILQYYTDEKKLSFEVPYNQFIESIKFKIDKCKLANFYNRDINISLNFLIIPKYNYLIEDKNSKALSYGNNNCNALSINESAMKNKLIILMTLITLIKSKYMN